LPIHISEWMNALQKPSHTLNGTVVLWRDRLAIESSVLQTDRIVAIPQQTASHVTLQDAIEAWNNGATSVGKLEQALGISHYAAYELYKEINSR